MKKHAILLGLFFVAIFIAVSFDKRICENIKSIKN